MKNINTRDSVEITLKNIGSSLAFIGDLNRLEAKEKITREENKILNYALLPAYSGIAPYKPKYPKDYNNLICETLLLSALYNLPVLCYKTLQLMQNIEKQDPSQTSKHFMTALHALSTAQHPEELPHIKTTGHNIISPDITTTQLIIDQLLVYLKEDKNLDDLNFFVQHVIKFINSESPLEEKSDVFYATLYALNLIQKHIEKLDNIENIQETISTLIDTMSTTELPLTDTQETPTETPISLFNLPGNTHPASSDDDSVSSDLTNSDADYSDYTDSDDDKDPPHP